MTKFLADRTGATAIEYGLIAALIAIAIIVAVQALGDQTNGLWGSVQSEVTTAINSVL